MHCSSVYAMVFIHCLCVEAMFGHRCNVLALIQCLGVDA